MPRPLKRGILGASTIILFKDIDKYAFMCGSNFNETDVTLEQWESGVRDVLDLNKNICNFGISRDIL